MKAKPMYHVLARRPKPKNLYMTTMQAPSVNGTVIPMKMIIPAQMMIPIPSMNFTAMTAITPSMTMMMTLPMKATTATTPPAALKPTPVVMMPLQTIPQQITDANIPTDAPNVTIVSIAEAARVLNAAMTTADAANAAVIIAE